MGKACAQPCAPASSPGHPHEHPCERSDGRLHDEECHRDQWPRPHLHGAGQDAAWREESAYEYAAACADAARSPTPDPAWDHPWEQKAAVEDSSAHTHSQSHPRTAASTSTPDTADASADPGGASGATPPRPDTHDPAHRHHRHRVDNRPIGRRRDTRPFQPEDDSHPGCL